MILVPPRSTQSGSSAASDVYKRQEGEACILSASCFMQEITFEILIDAEEDSRVTVIPTAVFKKLSDENIYVENFIYKQTTERFSDVMWTMQQILFMSFDRRLAVFLIDESAKTGKDTLTMTHDQIAKYTGSAREVVSRMLKYFENEGMVELGRGRVRLKDKKLSLIHISEPTRLGMISYAVFCLKKKKQNKKYQKKTTVDKK